MAKKKSPKYLSAKVLNHSWPEGLDDMQRLQSIIYRYLTNADFYNIYKPRGSEARGGGQTYIDLPTRSVTVEQWEKFLLGVSGVVEEQRAKGPAWSVPVRSIGVQGSDADPQLVVISQRRSQSLNITHQTLDRKHSNRVKSWHPDQGFPRPADPAKKTQCPKGLAVFLAKAGNEIWAGWFLNDGHAKPPASPTVSAEFRAMLAKPISARNRAGVIEFTAPVVWLDEDNHAEPFQSSLAAPSPAPLGQTEEARKKQRQRISATDSQGYELSPKRRKAVESHAMERAAKAYPGAEDTSKTKSFDLRAHEGTTEVRVEVKGTLGTGERVILTTNEVQNALGDGWRTDLFIVSGIKLEERDGQFIARGGRTRVIRGWRPLDEDLTPTQYRYKVPR